VGNYTSGATHGFLYDGTTYTTLDYPSASRTYASGIDGSNIVGFYDDVSGNRHGFFYNGTIWTNLDYPGATRTAAGSISSNNIVGYYDDVSGNRHGFLAKPLSTPPTPVGYNPQWLIITVISLTLAGGFLLRRRQNERQ